MELDEVQSGVCCKFAFENFLVLQRNVHDAIEILDKNIRFGTFAVPTIASYYLVIRGKDEVLLLATSTDKIICKNLQGEDRKLLLPSGLPLNPLAIFRGQYILTRTCMYHAQWDESQNSYHLIQSFSHPSSFAWTLSDQLICLYHQSKLTMHSFNEVSKSFEPTHVADNWNSVHKVVLWRDSIIILTGNLLYVVPSTLGISQKDASAFTLDNQKTGNCIDVCLWKDLLCTLQKDNQTAIVSLWNGNSLCCSLSLPFPEFNLNLDTYWDKILLARSFGGWSLEVDNTSSSRFDDRLYGQLDVTILKVITWKIERLFWIAWIKKEKDSLISTLPKELVKLLTGYCRVVLCTADSIRSNKRKRSEQEDSK